MGRYMSRVEILRNKKLGILFFAIVIGMNHIGVFRI